MVIRPDGALAKLNRQGRPPSGTCCPTAGIRAPPLRIPRRLVIGRHSDVRAGHAPQAQNRTDAPERSPKNGSMPADSPRAALARSAAIAHPISEIAIVVNIHPRYPDPPGGSDSGSQHDARPKRTARRPFKCEVDLSVARPVVEAAVWCGGRGGSSQYPVGFQLRGPCVMCPPVAVLLSWLSG